MKTKSALVTGLFFFAGMHVFAGNRITAVNEKLVKAFQDAFPKAEKVVWKENEDHYFVYFKDHEVNSSIEYDHEGNFLSSERYYKSEDLLPLHLAWEIHKRFIGQTIFGVTETNTGSENMYYVKLEDGNQWITVKGTSDGILAVVEKLNKQK